MAEKFVEANGLRLCYEEIGSPGDPAVLLIMGLGTQLIAWPGPFCRRLARAGYRVIRFDNRDVGCSQKLDHLGAPRLLNLLVSSQLGWRYPSAPYTLDDMAGDAIGLLDALDIPLAHVVGLSMGGMIAQVMAAKFPGRVLSLTSMMSTSGARSLPATPLHVRTFMARPVPLDEDGYVRHTMQFRALVGSPGHPPDESMANLIRVCYRRAHHPDGQTRQLAAIVASGDRVELLRRVRVPTLVIHGTADVMLPCEGGIHTAKLVSGSRLELIDGMGHDLPLPLLPKLAKLIAGPLAGAGMAPLPGAYELCA